MLDPVARASAARAKPRPDERLAEVATLASAVGGIAWMGLLVGGCWLWAWLT
jgi:hypothetical protein